MKSKKKINKFTVYRMENCNYIGCTINKLLYRQSEHINKCFDKKSSKYNYKLYKFIRKKNIQIKLIPIFIYNGSCSKKIMRLVEQFYINKYDSIKNGLNTYDAFKNKNKNKEYCKQYRLKNNQKIVCNICKSVVVKYNLCNHIRTQKCLTMKLKNNI
mgnify:FL=1|tara:strand:+ start:99 stop:569 length:471 start_codon:yes stop_codon:yes gene_type:complete